MRSRCADLERGGNPELLHLVINDCASAGDQVRGLGFTVVVLLGLLRSQSFEWKVISNPQGALIRASDHYLLPSSPAVEIAVLTASPGPPPLFNSSLPMFMVPIGINYIIS